MELTAKLTIQERKAIKAAPFNIRRLIAQQYRQLRMKALKEFNIQAVEARKEFMSKLESQLEEWEKSQRQQFQINIQKWEEQTWKDIEKQLQTSLEKAIASVPKGAEIKELKFEEGAWKITYELGQITPPETKKAETAKEGKDVFEVLKSAFLQPFPRILSPKQTVELVKGKSIAEIQYEEAQTYPSIMRVTREFGAGVTASFESTIYSPFRLAGVETPNIPPTLSSAVIGEALEKTVGWESYELESLSMKSPFYSAGTVAGDILAVWMGGEALSWAGGKIGGWIKQTETYQKLARTIKFSRVYRFYYEHFKVPAKAFYQTRIKLPAEKFLYEKSPWLYRRVFGRHAYYGLQAQLEWVNYEKPVAKGTAGLLEKAFGMPYFRSESLYKPMPTKEWARVLYKEWLAPRLKIERQLTWELSLYPAFPITTKGLELQKQMYPGGLLPSSEKIMQAERVKLPSGKTIYWTPRASLEFEQSVRGLMPNRLFIPKPPSGREWFRVIRGKPTTPMSRTLERAMFGRLSMGGLSGELILTRPNILYQPPSPQTFYKGITRQFKTEPEIKLPALPKIIKKSSSSLKIEKFLGTLISAIPSTSMETRTEFEVKPESVTAQIQKPRIKVKTKIAQLTSTVQTPKLRMKSQLVTIETKEIIKAIEIPPLSLPESEFKLPKPKRRKRKRPIGFYGWIGLEAPVPSARQILKFVLGGGRKK